MKALHLLLLAALPGITGFFNHNLNSLLKSTSSYSPSSSSRLPASLTAENIKDISIFMVGTVPFVWAGIEFNRRVLNNEGFGTSLNRVFFAWPDDDDDDELNNNNNNNTIVLGKSALSLAYLLFGSAFLITAISIISITTSAKPIF